eukprot:m.65990 g.65990  ORF g.65990 m.65990 type:complete len:141 (-) comp23629_c1_seq1:46-468(-)
MSSPPPTGLLRLALGAHIAYFVSMACAHFFTIKIPVLFIYYDVPFYVYQDKIISFCALTYAILFLAAFNHRVVVPYAIAALGVTVLGLSLVNVSDALKEVLTEDQSTLPYWIQTAMIASLLAVLLVLSSGSTTATNNKSK